MKRGGGGGRGGRPVSFRLPSGSREEPGGKDPQSKVPAPLFPPITLPQPPEECSDRDSYLVQKNALMSHSFKSSPFYLRLGTKRKDVERYSDQFIPKQNELDDLVKEKLELEIYPADLTGKVSKLTAPSEDRTKTKKKARGKASSKKKSTTTETGLSEFQTDLSMLEKEEEKGEKPEMEEKEKEKEEEPTEGIEEHEAEEEELEWDNDYTLNYDFERDIEDEIESGEDEPAF